MDKPSTELPQVCPLEAPDVWLAYLNGLDRSGWILCFDHFFAQLDVPSLSDDELRTWNDLLDTRHALLADLREVPESAEEPN